MTGVPDGSRERGRGTYAPKRVDRRNEDFRWVGIGGRGIFTARGNERRERQGSDRYGADR